MSIRLKLNGIRVIDVVSDLDERLEVVVIGTKTVRRSPLGLLLLPAQGGR